MDCCAGNRASASLLVEASSLLSILAAGRDDEKFDDDFDEDFDEEDEEDDESDATLIRVPGMDEGLDDDPDDHSSDGDAAPVDDDEVPQAGSWSDSGRSRAGLPASR